jgi:hypothetical protein
MEMPNIEDMKLMDLGDMVFPGQPVAQAPVKQET